MTGILQPGGRDPSRPPDQTPIVEATGVSKRYGATVALHDAHIRVAQGESHALVGRNGAGKSTLVGILTEIRAPDAGEILFSGAPAPALSDRAAWRSLVACVYQHSTIIPDLTVAENLFINRQPLERGLISWSMLRRQARELLDRWSVSVSESARAGDLKVEARQLVEIARALSYGARFIILDEPTAQLDGAEIQRLFRRMRELQAGGVTFLFISHHLQEVYEICQAVTVLRDARHIISAPVADFPKDRLIEAMTGEQVNLGMSDAVGRVLSPGAPVALEVKSLSGEDFGHQFRGAARRGAGDYGGNQQRPRRRGRGCSGTRRFQLWGNPDRSKNPAIRQRSKSAGARRRVRSQKPAQAGFGPRPIGRRQRHHDDQPKTGAVRFYRTTAKSERDHPHDRRPRDRDCRSRPAGL